MSHTHILEFSLGERLLTKKNGFIGRGKEHETWY